MNAGSISTIYFLNYNMFYQTGRYPDHLLLYVFFHILPSIFPINYGGIIFSERKPYFKPDYQIYLKREKVECTGNPSI